MNQQKPFLWFWSFLMVRAVLDPSLLVVLDSSSVTSNNFGDVDDVRLSEEVLRSGLHRSVDPVSSATRFGLCTP